MPHEEMVAKLEAYLKHIIFAQDFLATYKSILDAIEPYNAQINLAPGFFTLSQYSLSKCLFIELGKLYCGSGDEKTMSKFLA
jgi:hypothetical protein